MKPKSLIVMLLVISLSACNASNSTDNDNLKVVDESRATWNTLKLANESSYHFINIYTEFSSTQKNTTVFIKNNVVYKAEFYEWDRSNPKPLTPNKVTLFKTGDKAPMTIDELYSKCEKILNSRINAGFVSLDNNGLLSTCHDGGVAYDDFSNYINIENIMFD